MQIFRKPLTDAEYVEQLRRQLRLERWPRRVHALMGFAFTVICAVAIEQFIQMLANLAGPAQQNLAVGLFVVAILLGLVVGLWLASAA